MLVAAPRPRVRTVAGVKAASVRLVAAAISARAAARRARSKPGAAPVQHRAASRIDADERDTGAREWRRDAAPCRIRARSTGPSAAAATSSPNARTSRRARIARATFVRSPYGCGVLVASRALTRSNRSSSRFARDDSHGACARCVRAVRRGLQWPVLSSSTASCRRRPARPRHSLRSGMTPWHRPSPARALTSAGSVCERSRLSAGRRVANNIVFWISTKFAPGVPTASSSYARQRLQVVVADVRRRPCRSCSGARVSTASRRACQSDFGGGPMCVTDDGEQLHARPARCRTSQKIADDAWAHRRLGACRRARLARR